MDFRLRTPAQHRLSFRLLTGVLLFASSIVYAATDAALLDDYSDAAHSNVGAARLLVDDHAMGSQSSAAQVCADGRVSVKGTLIPGRGVPAFISFVSLVSPQGAPRDCSAYQGVRVRLKIHAGALSLQASSTEVDNFDFHSRPIATEGSEFQEVRVSFSEMKRAWSAQTPLNSKTITSINLVAFGLAKGEFSYEVDEIGFY